MNEYIILMLLTLLESILSTVKVKFRILHFDIAANFIGAFMKGISVIIASIAIIGNNNNTELVSRIIVIFLSAFIGNIFASKIFDYFFNKYKKDDKWIFILTPKTRKIGKLIADELRSNNIEVYTLEGYRDKISILPNLVISYNRQESKLVIRLSKKYEVSYQIM